MNEQSSGLYPKIESEKHSELLTKLSNQRGYIIQAEVKKLEDLVKHYEKVRRKWSKAQTVIRILGTGLGSVLAVGGTVLATVASSGIAVPIIIPAAIGGFGAVQTGISELTTNTLIKTKVKKYSNKIHVIEKYVNRLYHFYHLAIQDAEITVEEMAEYYKILDEYKNEMNGVIAKHEKEEEFDLNAIKMEALNEAKKEAVGDLKKKFKEEAKAKLLSAASI